MPSIFDVLYRECAVRASLRCESSSCFGLAALSFPKRIAKLATPTTLLIRVKVWRPRRNGAIPRKEVILELQVRSFPPARHLLNVLSTVTDGRSQPPPYKSRRALLTHRAPPAGFDVKAVTG